MCSGSEAGSYLRLISLNCRLDSNKEEEEKYETFGAAHVAYHAQYFLYTGVQVPLSLSFSRSLFLSLSFFLYLSLSRSLAAVLPPYVHAGPGNLILFQNMATRTTLQLGHASNIEAL